ncbi:hypothetical protein CCR90_13575 [Rhodovulum sulfidophilum]|uniref:Shedu immune nuclease family protein n=1 Tax=Rhodovulum sulfidophilum TaxID=35806 RepID=UPI0019129670|nr:Shedu immune nuclease family protein [Rhodovulum sulfidophilum]MBK5924778.1 hypothetical protein [Rhodovulum sulfidophilum]
MIEAEKPTSIVVETRPKEETSLKLYQFADGRQDLVVEITDKMRHFLFHESSEAEFNYRYNQMRLASYDPSDRLLTTYPKKLPPNHSHFGLPKYANVRRISMEDGRPLFERKDREKSGKYYFGQFPNGFVDKPFDGFGLTYTFRFIVDAIEEFPGIEEIRLCRGSKTAIDGTVFRLPISIYESIRKTLNRTHKAALTFANAEKRSFLQSNLVNPLLPQSEQNPVMPRTEADLSAVLNDAINASGRRSKARAANQSTAVRVVKTSAKALITDHHDELLELNREIELVTLKDVIAKFEARLANTSLKEDNWQKFLSTNPFILRLAFGLPAVVFKEQMPVGGWNFDNKGGKLADFVVKSGAVGNLSIIEIKTPTAKLLGKTQYRGGIHAPSAGISGAVTQVMDQRYLLQENIASFLRAEPHNDVHTYAVGCIVVIGTTPTSEPAKKSFELYRNNLVGVTVITFDELLDKLKALHQFLVEPSLEEEPDPQDFRGFWGDDLDDDLEEDEDGEE